MRGGSHGSIPEHRTEAKFFSRKRYFHRGVYYEHAKQATSPRLSRGLKSKVMRPVVLYSKCHITGPRSLCPGATDLGIRSGASTTLGLAMT